MEFSQFSFCCCGGGGSGPGSGGDFEFNCTECLEEIGDWPDEWPDELTVTISGGCCAGMNNTVQITKWFGTGIGPRYVNEDDIGEPCGEVSDPLLQWFIKGLLLQCENGRFRLSGISLCMDSDPPGPISLEFVLLPRVISCVPFHATVSVATREHTPHPELCCVGVVNFEITE